MATSTARADDPRVETVDPVPSSWRAPGQTIPAEELVTSLVDRSERLLEALRDSEFEETHSRKAPRLFRITEAAAMVGRSTQAIRDAERDGRLPHPAVSESTGQRRGYTLGDINVMRRQFGHAPKRLDTEGTVRMSFGNFKGGIAKTTLSCHFAQWLAMQGYRVLLIDADSQASTTMMFGYHPDSEIEPEGTLHPYLSGERDSLDYAIVETHWDGLDLVPANLSLYDAEFLLAGLAGSPGAGWISRLHEGIQSVEHRYDVVLIDMPPALGMISLNVLRALTGLVVPTPAAMLDFHSTASFFRMLEEVLEPINERLEEPVRLGFLKLLISKFDAAKPAQEFVARMTGQHFSESVISEYYLHSAEVDSASAHWQTVFELQQPAGSRRTHNRCVASMNAVFGEIEREIQRQWPSQTRRKLGVDLAL